MLRFEKKNCLFFNKKKVIPYYLQLNTRARMVRIVRHMHSCLQLVVSSQNRTLQFNKNKIIYFLCSFRAFSLRYFNMCYKEASECIYFVNTFHVLVKYVQLTHEKAMVELKKTICETDCLLFYEISKNFRKRHQIYDHISKQTNNA